MHQAQWTKTCCFCLCDELLEQNAFDFWLQLYICPQLALHHHNIILLQAAQQQYNAAFFLAESWVHL